jgi:hypothetical protein
MDADVKIQNRETIACLIRKLEVCPKAYVAVPRIIKDVLLKPKQGLWDRVSLAAARTRHSGGTGFAGAMYCGRGDILRRIWFPIGVLGDDAFLNGIIMCDFCRSKDPVKDRIVADIDVCVTFEAYTRLSDIWANHKRRAVIRGIDAVLYKFLWANVSESEDALAVIARMNRFDPYWFQKTLQTELAEKGWWVLPSGVLCSRFRQLLLMPKRRAMMLVPVTFAGFLWDIGTHLAANRAIKRREISTVWKDKSIHSSRDRRRRAIASHTAQPRRPELNAAGDVQ